MPKNPPASASHLLFRRDFEADSWAIAGLVRGVTNACCLACVAFVALLSPLDLCQK